MIRIGILTAMVVSVAWPSSIIASVKRPFTVRDSIEMVTFSDPFTRASDAACKKSPDGKYFVFVTTEGVLRTNQLVSTLWLYSSDEVDRYLHQGTSQALTPHLLLRIEGTPKAREDNSYGALITGVQWSSDSQSILALIEQPSGRRRLYRIPLSGARPVALTSEKVDVKTFSEAKGTIAYLSVEHLSPSKVIGTPLYPTESDLTGLSLVNVLFSDEFPDPASFWPALDLWVRYQGVNRQINLGGRWYFPSSAGVLRLAVSPNGNAMIAAQPVPAIPVGWNRYRAADSLSSFAPTATGTDRSGKGFNWPWQYVYVDLAKKTITPLVDAPSGVLEGYIDASEAVWSLDSRSVVFTNSFLPMPIDGENRSDVGDSACAAAVYRVGTKSVSCVAWARFPKQNERLVSAVFGDSSDQVILRWSSGNRRAIEVYDRTIKGWRRQQSVSTSDEAGTKLRLFIRQDINDPPTLWATEPANHVAKELWNPNPQLMSLQLGYASVYTWKDGTGYEWHAGLVLPPKFVRGHRYPLVIQTHGFYNEHEFLVDGSYTTGFAARPLAAAGFIVLQMEDRADRHTKPPRQEAFLSVDGFTSAIKHLNRDGLIDPTRVGIIGFSRSAWYVEEALIRQPHLFRAATIIDGIDQSYMNYMLFASPKDPEGALEAEAANGAKPFGFGVEQWIKHAAGFNLDKVDTPLRIEAITSMSVLQEWEIYSSLYQQGKPVDLVYIPSGQHILQAPQNRYASQQGNVDWFRFWLQGYEDPDPAKAAQYRRWEKLRAMQEADEKQAQPVNH